MSPITNDMNLNEPIVKAMSKGGWYSGENDENKFCSVTELVGAVKYAILRKRYKEEIPEDASDMLYALYGSAVHDILDRANDTDAEFKIMNHIKKFYSMVKEVDTSNMTEEELIDWSENSRDAFIGYLLDLNLEKLFIGMSQDRYLHEDRLKYVTKDGLIVYGGFDLFDTQTGILYDYKLTSIWSYIYRDEKDSKIADYTKQLNIYAMMLRRAGHEVNGLRIVMLFRDYSKSKAKFESGYPPTPIVEISIPLLPDDVVVDMVEDGVSNIAKWINTPDDLIPHCTHAERWQSPDTFAVYKVKNKKTGEMNQRATKVCYTETEAKNYIRNEVSVLEDKDIAKGEFPEFVRGSYDWMYKIIPRMGTPKKCVDYCIYNVKCNFYRNYLKENN